MCYILCMTRTSVYVACGGAGGKEGGCRGEPPYMGEPKFFFPRFSCPFLGSPRFCVHFGQFFGTWFFTDGFLFLVKELGLLTNPGHWIRVLDVVGSYMYIVL
jgi:hypothetical protein